MNKEYTMRDIAEYVISHFPDSCLAYNDKNYHYNDDELIIELLDFFKYEIIGLCSCGDPNMCMKDIRDYLEILNTYDIECTTLEFKQSYKNKQFSFKQRFKCESMFENSLLLFMAYIIDKKELTEHDGSIGSAWITDLGRMCLQVLKKADLEE